ncbi:MAG: hypothetical protein WBC44_21195 [Planctomycetaceae bacterium]
MFRMCSLILAASASLLTSGLIAADDAVLDQVARDWTKRQQIADAVRYEVVGTEMRPRGVFNNLKLEAGVTDPDEDLPSEDRFSSYNILLTVYFDKDKNWMRVERERDILNHGPEFITEYIIDVSNGEEFQRYIPLDRNPRIAELKQAGKRMQFELTAMNSTSAYIVLREYTERPLYWAHGLIPMPGPMDQLRRPVDLTGWQVAGGAVHEGRECVILRTPTRFDGALYSELWVDLFRNSAIVRFADVREGEETLMFLVAYQQTPHGWLPESWTVEQRASSRDASMLLQDRKEM